MIRTARKTMLRTFVFFAGSDRFEFGFVDRERVDDDRFGHDRIRCTGSGITCSGTTGSGERDRSSAHGATSAPMPPASLPHRPWSRHRRAALPDAHCGPDSP